MLSKKSLMLYCITALIAAPQSLDAARIKFINKSSKDMYVLTSIVGYKFMISQKRMLNLVPHLDYVAPGKSFSRTFMPTPDEKMGIFGWTTISYKEFYKKELKRRNNLSYAKRSQLDPIPDESSYALDNVSLDISKLKNQATVLKKLDIIPGNNNKKILMLSGLDTKKITLFDDGSWTIENWIL